MDVNPAAIPWRDGYKLLVGSILPRPIAFVSTISADGVLNLAPFSFFTVVAANPMTLAFCPMRQGRDGGPKDTLVNIQATGEFVVNIVSESFAAAMNVTSGPFPPEVDEFAVSGLTPVPSVTVRPPRVVEALVAYECKLLQVVEVGGAEPGAGALVLGTVQSIHVDDGGIHIERLQPIGRLGGDEYVRCTDRFTLERPR